MAPGSWLLAPRSPAVWSALALSFATCLAAACDPEVGTRGPASESADDDGGSEDDGGGSDVPPFSLSFEDLNLGPNWEPTPEPLPRSAAPGGQDSVELPTGLTAEELAEQAEQDPLWRAADGTRYEAMLMLPDGTTYGRRGAAPEALHPDEATVFGGNNPIDAPEYDVPEGPPVDPEGIILGGYLYTDRRTRVTTTTGFPESAIGAMNDTSAAGFTLCTATKIGPRALITASHCVMRCNQYGLDCTYDDMGFFHPGQTNSSHPNSDGAISYAGAYWRDWRNGRRFDYSILLTEDTWESVSLGWLSVTYFTDLDDYVGVNTRVLGYPGKTQDCWASPLSNKNCDGWMYRDSDALDSVSTSVYRQLRYDIDTQPGQSGAAPFTNIDGVWRILGVHWGHNDDDPDYNRAARFRDDMWDDVCEWIESAPSTLIGFNCN